MKATRKSAIEQAKIKGIAAGKRTATLLKDDRTSLMRWGAEQIKKAHEAAKANDPVQAAFFAAAGLEAQTLA